MREILFRGKRTDNGEWIEGGILQTENWASIYVCKDYQGSMNEPPCCDVEEYEVIPETVGQYTGLTDTNGKKTFEGDICRVVYLDKRCGSNGKHYEVENALIEEVVFKKGTFCFKTTVEDIALYRPIGFDIYEKLKIKDFEVIGNIYDNPELLEGDKE